jgi:hypothetical protein
LSNTDFCNGNDGEKSGKTLRTKASAGEYLAFLSVKYEVDPDQFFNAIKLSMGDK